jgi:phasin family protein
MLAPQLPFAEYQKDQLQALHALSQVAFDTTGKIVALNMAAVRAALKETAENTETLLGVKDVQELLTLNGTLAQPGLEKFLGYSRNLYGILSAAGEQARTILEAQTAVGKEAFAEVVETSGKNAPTGAEPVVSLLKNAFDAYGRAYDTMARATRQAVETAESNFASATEATVEAVSAANGASKAKPKKAA